MDGPREQVAGRRCVEIRLAGRRHVEMDPEDKLWSMDANRKFHDLFASQGYEVKGTS